MIKIKKDNPFYVEKKYGNEISFFLYNYQNIDKLIESRKIDLIDKIRVGNLAHLISLKRPNDTLEDMAIKIINDSYIKRLEKWRQLINSFMSKLYDEEDKRYYYIIKYKYFEKLDQDYILEKLNLSKVAFKKADIYLKWLLFEGAKKKKIYKINEGSEKD